MEDESLRELSCEEKSKSSALAYIRRAVREGLPKGCALPTAVERLLVHEWPGYASSIETIRTAILELEELGQLHQCRGRYWKTLLRSAGQVDLTDVESVLRQRFREALLRLNEITPP